MESKIDKKYSYDRFGSKGARVGQAAYDILSKEQPTYTAEEILEEMGKGLLDYIEGAIEKGCKKYDGTFYVLHIFRKALVEHQIEIVMGQRAVCFQKGPLNSSFYMNELPHPSKTLYKVNSKDGIPFLLWNVPGWGDCKSIKKNPHVYDSRLVQWVKEATANFQSAG